MNMFLRETVNEKKSLFLIQEFNMFLSCLFFLTSLIHSPNQSLLHNNFYASSFSIFFLLFCCLISFGNNTHRNIFYVSIVDMFYCQRFVVFYAFIFYLTENYFQIIIMLSVMNEFIQR